MEAKKQKEFKALFVIPGKRIPTAITDYYNANLKLENEDYKLKAIPACISDLTRSKYHEVVFIMIPKSIHPSDIENCGDLFMHYADAPLTYLVADKTYDCEDGLETLPEGLLDKVFDNEVKFCPSLNALSCDAELSDIINNAISVLELFEESDIKATFNKIDVDESGYIDNEEFGNLMGDLGYELDDD